jgi:hypothetical protein
VEPTPGPRAPRREAALALVLTAAFFVLGHGHALPPRRVLSATDLVLAGEPFAREHPLDTARPANDALWDQALQFGPWLAFASRELRSGHLPLWNPHAGCGAAHAANDQAAVFFPGTLLAALLGPAAGLFLLALAKHALAGLGVFLFLRSRDLRPASALAGGLAFAFAAPIVVWQGYPVSSALAFAGWVLLAVERSAGERGARPSLLLALALALLLLAGHAQTALHVGLGAAVYALARAWALGRREGPLLLLRLALGAALGLALAAPHVALFLDELSRSETFARRLATSVQTTVPLRLLVLLVFPDRDGNPRDGSFLTHDGMSYIELTEGSVGAAALALALLGALGPTGDRTARLARGALLLAALGLAIVHGAAPFLAHVPPFSLARNHRLVGVVALALAVAAGAGAELVLARKAHVGRAALAFAALVLALLALGGPSFAGPTDDGARALRGPIFTHLAPLLAAVAALSVAAAAAVRGFTPRAAGALLILTIGVEQAILFAGGWNTAVPADRFFPASATVAALDAAPPGDRARALVLGDRGVLPPNVPTAYALDSVGRYDVMGSLAFAPLREALGGRLKNPDMEFFLAPVNPRIARVLGVRRFLVGLDWLDPRLAWDELAAGPTDFTPPVDRARERFVATGDLRAIRVFARLEGTARARFELSLEDGTAAIRTAAAWVENRPVATPVFFSFPSVADAAGRAFVATIRRADAMGGSVRFVRLLAARPGARWLEGREGESLACSIARTSELAASFHEVGCPGVLEDSGALPRVRWVGGVVRVPTVEAALARLASPEHDPRASVVLIGDEGKASARTVDLIGPGEARLTSYESGRVAVATRSTGDGYVVLADAWHPCWRATIDGEPAPILRADAALRAVSVAYGEHTVVFTYDPPALTLGFALAAGALAIVLELAWRSRTRRAS